MTIYLLEHIKHVFIEDELQETSTVRKFQTVQPEGKRNIEREIEFYYLDTIISHQLMAFVQLNTFITFNKISDILYYITSYIFPYQIKVQSYKIQQFRVKR